MHTENVLSINQKAGFIRPWTLSFRFPAYRSDRPSVVYRTHQFVSFVTAAQKGQDWCLSQSLLTAQTAPLKKISSQTEKDYNVMQ